MATMIGLQRKKLLLLNLESGRVDRRSSCFKPFKPICHPEGGAGGYPPPAERLCRNAKITRMSFGAAKNLAFPATHQNEILRLSPQDHIATQSQPRGRQKEGV